MSRPLKLAPLQTSLRHVRRSAHNADFCRLRISKYPANALEMKYFFTLGIDYSLWYYGSWQVESGYRSFLGEGAKLNRKKKSVIMRTDSFLYASN